MQITDSIRVTATTDHPMSQGTQSTNTEFSDLVAALQPPELPAETAIELESDPKPEVAQDAVTKSLGDTSMPPLPPPAHSIVASNPRAAPTTNDRSVAPVAVESPEKSPHPDKVTEKGRHLRTAAEDLASLAFWSRPTQPPEPKQNAENGRPQSTHPSDTRSSKVATPINLEDAKDPHQPVQLGALQHALPQDPKSEARVARAEPEPSKNTRINSELLAQDTRKPLQQASELASPNVPNPSTADVGALPTYSPEPTTMPEQAQLPQSEPQGIPRDAKAITTDQEIPVIEKRPTTKVAVENVVFSPAQPPRTAQIPIVRSEPNHSTAPNTGPSLLPETSQNPNVHKGTKPKNDPSSTSVLAMGRAVPETTQHPQHARIDFTIKREETIRLRPQTQRTEVDESSTLINQNRINSSSADGYPAPMPPATALPAPHEPSTAARGALRAEPLENAITATQRIIPSERDQIFAQLKENPALPIATVEVSQSMDSIIEAADSHPPSRAADRIHVEKAASPVHRVEGRSDNTTVAPMRLQNTAAPQPILFNASTLPRQTKDDEQPFRLDLPDHGKHAESQPVHQTPNAKPIQSGFGAHVETTQPTPSQPKNRSKTEPASDLMLIGDQPKTDLRNRAASTSPSTPTPAVNFHISHLNSTKSVPEKLKVESVDASLVTMPTRIETHSPKMEAAPQQHSISNVIQQISPKLPGPSDGLVEVQLSPEELGRVKLQVGHHENAITLTIHADRPETVDLFRRNIVQLERDLSALGFNDVAFSFSGGQGENSQSAKARPPQDASLEPLPTDVTDAPPSHVSLDGVNILL